MIFYQNAGLPKWSSSEIRNQDVHTNGPVLDETILADPEVMFSIVILVTWTKSTNVYQLKLFSQASIKEFCDLLFTLLKPKPSVCDLYRRT
jgi:hypothetical protein